MSFLSLTERDRDEMLAAIGVDSIDELFRDIPPGVRFDRELDLEPALSEQEIVAHLEELAARNVDTGRELSFLGAGIYDHYVPAVVDAVLQRGELLTAYTPYQAEMSQGVLQAIFEYQTAICELTGMDVSNASGYDGTTVAADACYVAKHVTGRSRVVLAETLNPQVRQVVKTYAPGFGLEVVEVPHRDGVTDPDELGEAARDAACVIFQQPNFFGCLEPAPDLAAAANDAGALPVAHVDPVSLGVLEAPGAYGCALAIGEGQAAGNYQSYGGPHYGFMAARSDYVRRMPGRIVGETTDVEGRRAYVLTLQTREQHIRREKATSNITTNQTLLALAGLVHLSWLGPQGLREQGETCMALAAYAKERLGLPLLFPEQTTFKEFAIQRRTARRRGDPRRARAGRASRLRAPPRLRRHGGRAPRLRHREAHARGHRPARGGAGRMKLIYERSQEGRRASSLPHEHAPGARRSPTSSAASSRRACPRSRSPSSSAISRTSRRARSASTPASIRSAPAR